MSSRLMRLTLPLLALALALPVSAGTLETTVQKALMAQLNVDDETDSLPGMRAVVVDADRNGAPRLLAVVSGSRLRLLDASMRIISDSSRRLDGRQVVEMKTIDIDHDGRNELLVSTAFDQAGDTIDHYFAIRGAALAPIAVASNSVQVDLNGDGIDEILAGPLREGDPEKSSPRILRWDGSQYQLTDQLLTELRAATEPTTVRRADAGERLSR